MAIPDREVRSLEVINNITAVITIKSHPTDNTKIVLDVSGTEYTLEGLEVLQAVHNSMNKE